jgi:hypothetical protein
MFKWIVAQIEWLKSFLSEDNGLGSSKRLMGFLVVLAFLFSYVKTTLFNNKVEDIPINWAFTIAAIIGLGVWSNIVDKNKPQ